MADWILLALSLAFNALTGLWVEKADVPYSPTSLVHVVSKLHAATNVSLASIR